MTDTHTSLALRAAHDIVVGRTELHLEPRDVALLVLINDDIRHRSSGGFIVEVEDIRAHSAKLDAFEASHSLAAERRLTESIERLLKAECLVRADMTRLRDAEFAEYQLTAIGETIAEWKLSQVKLDGEPLAAILSAFNVQLTSICDSAIAATNGEDWKRSVAIPVQVVVRELLTAMQRHQRQLDRAHNEVRLFVPTLLRESSEDAIEKCKVVVDNVMRTIRDLVNVTFNVSNAAFSLLDRIEDLSGDAQAGEVLLACEDARKRLESIMEWTTLRQRDWGTHFDAVHSHLRFVAMVDRSRRVTDALKKAVSDPPSWTLQVSAMPRLLAMRDREVNPIPKPAVRRRRHDYAQVVETVEPSEVPALLARLVHQGLESGICRWSDVIGDALDLANADEVMLRLPEVMSLLAAGGVVTSSREYVQISESCKIEQLEVRART